jgi:hypothetical protein
MGHIHGDEVRNICWLGLHLQFVKLDMEQQSAGGQFGLAVQLDRHRHMNRLVLVYREEIHVDDLAGQPVALDLLEDGHLDRVGALLHPAGMVFCPLADRSVEVTERHRHRNGRLAGGDDHSRDHAVAAQLAQPLVRCARFQLQQNAWFHKVNTPLPFGAVGRGASYMITRKYYTIITNGELLGLNRFPVFPVDT